MKRSFIHINVLYCSKFQLYIRTKINLKTRPGPDFLSRPMVYTHSSLSSPFPISLSTGQPTVVTTSSRLPFILLFPVVLPTPFYPFSLLLPTKFSISLKISFCASNSDLYFPTSTSHFCYLHFPGSLLCIYYRPVLFPSSTSHFHCPNFTPIFCNFHFPLLPLTPAFPSTSPTAPQPAGSGNLAERRIIKQ